MRKQFQLNHAVSQPDVQQQLRWLLAHPHYLDQFSQAQPYLYHILSEIKKQNLPGELALIPMIESAYNPFAYSGVGAAGLWQLMPATGHDFGLIQDWWSDSRRGILSSTQAALSYLAYLHQMFHNDWLLAVASYNAGVGRITRLINNTPNPAISFWSLTVPAETKVYVPRLLALAEIIQHPAQYHIRLPDIPHKPYFAEVNVGHQIDLNHAAKLAGISYQELIKLNPGYNRWTTPPYSPYKLLIPQTHVAMFHHNLARMHPVDRQVTRRTLPSPPTKPSPPPVVAKINRTTQVRANTPQIPTRTYRILHIVQHNENIDMIQRKYQVSIADIRAWNHLPADIRLTPGQQLILWKQASMPLKQTYIAREGDTLSMIAAKHHMSINTLLQYNPILKTSVLHPGQMIKLT